jgi:hypothetical protein
METVRAVRVKNMAMGPTGRGIKMTLPAKASSILSETEKKKS